MTTITITEESPQGEKQSRSIELLEECISVRELLQRYTYQAVTEYNARQTEPLRSLVQPGEVEQTLNGEHSRKRCKLDWQAQYEQALSAFERHRYLILVDRKQVTSLDALLELHAGTKVTFFRLVPLIGG